MKFRYFLMVLALIIYDKTFSQKSLSQSFNKNKYDADNPCNYILNPELRMPQNKLILYSDHIARRQQHAEEQHIMTRYIFYEFRSAFDSIPERKNETTRTENGDIVLLQLYSWDDELLDFYAWRKWIYQYNALGEQTFVFMVTYDNDLSNWIMSYKDSISYGQSGEKTYYRYEWNKDDNLWFLLSKHESKLDEYGRTVGHELMRLDGETNAWIGCCKNEVIYDANGNSIQLTQFEWNFDDNDWIQWGKNEWNYGDDGKIELDIRYEWDRDKSEWKNISKSAYSYNEEGDQFIDKFEWNASLDSWILKGTEENYFNNKGDRIVQVEYTTDSSTNTLTGSLKKMWIYNDFGFNSIIINYTWDNETNYWEVSSKEFIDERSVPITGIDDFNPKDIVIYPNPGATFLNFSGISKFTIIQIFSTQGALLKQTPYSNEPISILDLPKGLYLVKINKEYQPLVTKNFIKK